MFISTKWFIFSVSDEGYGRENDACNKPLDVSENTKLYARFLSRRLIAKSLERGWLAQATWLEERVARLVG